MRTRPPQVLVNGDVFLAFTGDSAIPTLLIEVSYDFTLGL
jgi:hypothetical protein